MPYILFAKNIPDETMETIRRESEKGFQVLTVIASDDSRTGFSNYLTAIGNKKGAYFVYENEYLVVVRHDCGIDWDTTFPWEEFIVPLDALSDVLVTLYRNKWWGDFMDEINDDGIYIMPANVSSK